MRAEGILGIHQRADFLALGGARQDRMQQRGAAGGGRSDDFGKRTARESAGRGIEFRDTGGHGFRSGAFLPCECSGKDRCELVLEDGRAHIRLLFAYT